MSAKSIPERIARRVLGRLGYEVYHWSKAFGDATYGLVVPIANYSPWNADQEFRSVFSTIRDHTMVDKYRCYELWSLIEQSSKLCGSILEVGVWRGGTGALLAKKAELCGIDDSVYLCDTFRGVVKAGATDTIYKGGEHSDSNHRIVDSLVRDRLGLDHVVILEGVFPEDTADRIPAGPFRLCHVDVDVYESANGVVDWVWERLVPGGIVVYDDYGFSRCPGVTKYVDEQRGLRDRVVVHNLNGHAIVIKLAVGGATADRSPEGRSASASI